MNQSLSFRVFKSIMALPVTVAIIIPSMLLYFSGWHPSDIVLWRFLIGAVCFLAGLLLAVSTFRLFFKLGNGTLAPWDPTSKLIVSGPYAYVRNPMITGIVLILTGEALMLSSCSISRCQKSLVCASVLARNMKSIARMYLDTSPALPLGSPER